MTRIVDLKRNLSLLTDFYELTMSNGYFLNGMRDRVAVFDMFFRTVPDNGGFAIFAGLEQLVEYLENLSFSEEDIEYLREQGQFSNAFLEYLANFEFACDIWAPKEGTPIFPGEPVVVVKGPLIQTQLVETMVLLTINHQSLIATKTNRMIRAAGGRAIFEFGSRRAQGYDAAVLGARASYIGGCAATACVLAGRRYGIPVVGTMAHSWVQSFDSEYEAFKSYAELYPDSCTLLVDTYNVIKSGVPNAIRVFNEVLLPKGFRPKGIRIDSGDIAYLSKRARAMLDEAGFADVKITASNSLDEYLIRDLILQGAKVDLFGVGENLITSKSAPVFGGVYKLAAVQEQEGGEFIPKIKVSESVEKITTPGFKRLYRLYDKENGKALADYITLYDETVDDSKPLTIFDQHAPWKKQTLENYVSRPLLEPIFSKGKLVYTLPSLDEVKAYCTEQVNTLWDEVTRFENPHTYYVDLSQKLWDMKYNLLEEISL
ncbi:nicotinate phosphoribosyltransferase [Phocea massiliensis]|uniref:Nicotinate phosphoribosyltransferase n=1 Tax=uncultured Anaerotruncus sp. TaxID=905011 RepID=A0A6N2S5W9_9FIRM|nr:nicotinate phosphoribosyltransferase [Merdimmobilis hominis]MCD4836375.1 nicotinate phosphoribosyltransferase [Merdimmobilis hominis]